MTDPATKKKKLIDKVVAHARAHLPAEQAQQAETFIRGYYLRVAPEDLLEHDHLRLYGAAVSHWHLCMRRSPGERLVRVYNPRTELHGWHSTHTIVEAVHEDIPFLVDSVRMLLNRHGLTVHLIIHPVMRLKRDHHGGLLEVLPEDAADPESVPESVMHFEVDRQIRRTSTRTWRSWSGWRALISPSSATASTGWSGRETGMRCEGCPARASASSGARKATPFPRALPGCRTKPVTGPPAPSCSS